MTKQDIDIPEGWMQTTLGVFADIIMGQSPRGESYNQVGEGIPFYQGVTEFGERFVGIKTYTTEPTKIVPPNTILFSVRAPVGKVNFTRHEACIGRGNAGIVSKNGETEFLFYLLQYIERQIKNRSSGTVFDSISGKELKEVPIIVPVEKSEQKEIAGILSSFDSKIELLRKQNETLEKTAQTIFQEWFGKYSIDDDLPEGWRVGKLGEISKLIAGGDRPENTTTIKTDTNVVPIFSNGISDDGLYGYTDKPRITEESITVSARGTIGYISLKTEPYVPIVRLIAVIPNNIDVSAKYLFLSLKNKNISGTGTTQEQLTIPDFSTMEIIIPENNIMNEFTLITNSFYEKIIKNTLQVKSLSKARDELLPKLMSGVIRV